MDVHVSFVAEVILDWKLQIKEGFTNFPAPSFGQTQLLATSSLLPHQRSGRRQISQDGWVYHTILSGSAYFICYWRYLGLEVTPPARRHA